MLKLFTSSRCEISNVNVIHKTEKISVNTCRQKPTNCLSEFDHFVGLAHKGLKTTLIFDNK